MDEASSEEDVEIRGRGDPLAAAEERFREWYLRAIIEMGKASYPHHAPSLSAMVCASFCSDLP